MLARLIGLFALLLALGPALAQAWQDCTDGVDCYCDRVRNPADALYDPLMLICEDFEAVTLHDDVNFGGGAP